MVQVLYGYGSLLGVGLSTESFDKFLGSCRA